MDVRVGQGSFVIQNVELLSTREEKKFPASGRAK